MDAGTHLITARASDNIVATSSLSSALRITIDTTASSAPSTLNLYNYDDSGSSDSDNVTSNTTPTFIIDAEADSTVEIFSNGISLGTTTAEPHQNWTFTVPSALDAGTYLITATANDAAGNESDESEALSLTIDTTRP